MRAILGFSIGKFWIFKIIKMKPNRAGLFLLLTITLIGMAVLLVHKSVEHRQRSINKTQSIQKESTARTNDQSLPAQGKPTYPTTSRQAILITNQATVSRSELLKISLVQKNAPIDFYGKVIDQEYYAVPDVHIVMHVRQWHLDATSDPWGNQFQKFNLTTDSNGTFALKNSTGDSLTIESAYKDGYRLSSKTQKGYGYGDVSNPHHPDPQNPVILKMWKLGEPQQLISHHLTRIGIPVDGQPVQFELFNGKKVSSGGQLTVRLRRDPQILTQGNTRYDWSLELEIPHGGLAVNNDEFMYQAFEHDYHDVFKFAMPKDVENWTPVLNQQFYIQLENGKYFGSLVVHLSTIHNTPPLGLNLDIVINPNGSRNLQP